MLRSARSPTVLQAQTLVLRAGVDVVAVDESVPVDGGNYADDGVDNSADYVAVVKVDEIVAADERYYAADSVANVVDYVAGVQRTGAGEVMSIPTAMLLSNTPDGEIPAIPPMAVIERKSYTTTITINSRQRPPLNDFPHLGNTAASDHFLFDLRVAGRLQQVSSRFLVISHELLTVDRNQKVTVLTDNHVERAGGIELIVCSNSSLPKKSCILRSQLMTFPGSFGIFGGVRLLKPPLLKHKLSPLPPLTHCTLNLSALPAVSAAVIPAVSVLSLSFMFSFSAATTRACRASSCFPSSSSTLLAIPCCLPAPCRGT